jgi:hypothetical protein
VIDEAVIPHHKYSNSTLPLTLTAHYEETGSGLLGAKSGRTPVRIEAVVCASCAYTELFAKDLDVLERFARTGRGNVRRVTAR